MTDKTLSSEMKCITNQDNNCIPIKNIYYMLSYAFKFLEIDSDIKKECDDFHNVHDLFSRILVEGIDTLIRRGFYKEYIVENEDMSNLRGKINISKSIKQQTFIHKRLNCEFDDFNENILFNKILKTTMYNLIRFKGLNKDLKKKIRNLYFYFDSVDLILLNKHIFNSFSWNRNNKHYQVLIEICKMIHETKLPDESISGEVFFKEFIRDKKEMEKLYEKFVLNFYKKELKDIQVSSRNLKWDSDENYHLLKGKNYLPIMKTDIVLQNNDKQLIIDTKFYKKIFLQRKYGSSTSKDKLNSNHLYQIHAYVTNSVFDGEISGMLLYASLGEDISYQYKIKDNLILIRTIDLNQDWKGIDKKLKEIVHTVFY